MIIPLNPMEISKYVNELVIPPQYVPTIIKDPITGKIISHNYTVTMSEFNSISFQSKLWTWLRMALPYY